MVKLLDQFQHQSFRHFKNNFEDQDNTLEAILHKTCFQLPDPDEDYPGGYGEGIDSLLSLAEVVYWRFDQDAFRENLVVNHGERGPAVALALVGAMTLLKAGKLNPK